MDWERIWATVSTQLTTFGLKVAGAIAVWIIGRWLIALAVRLLSGALTRQEVDPTLQRYIANIVGVALNVVLVVAILGYFGVETTSFAALIISPENATTFRFGTSAHASSTNWRRCSRSNQYRRLSGFWPTATTTSSNSAEPRRITSTCPLVTGSKDPG